MMTRSPSWLFLFMLLIHSAYAQPSNRTECFVFIDTAIPEQLSLFKQFNEEYYLSRTLQNKGSITFINIGIQPLANTTLVPIINDKEGIWVRKFKPKSLPAMFLVDHGNHFQRAVVHTREIRQCLQGR